MGYRTGSVESADGTAITHRIVGTHGAAVVLVHGALQAAQNFMRLAEALSTRFVVYVPDRRGRRPGVPVGENYGLTREAEDLDALIRASGSRRVFGLSSGAIIALYTAIEHRGVERLALYEPPLTIDGTDPTSWQPRFERAMAAGDRGAAMTEIIKGTGDRSLMTRLPPFVLAPLLRVAIARNAKAVSGEDISIRDLIPTLNLDMRVVSESPTMVNPRISELHSEVLLLGGDKTAHHHRLALDALAKRLPDATRIELNGIGHLAADDRGRPEEVARVVGDFFVG